MSKSYVFFALVAFLIGKLSFPFLFHAYCHYNLVSANAVRTKNKNKALSSSQMKHTVTTVDDHYFPCAVPAKSDDWTYSSEYTTINCTGNTYVGAYGANESISITYDASKPHRGVGVSFKLILLDSWDDETFIVTADGNTVYSYKHVYTESTASTCGNIWADEIVEVKFGFNHTGETVELVFTSNLDQDADDEAWGICDVSINLMAAVVTAQRDEIGSIKPITFECISPAVDNDWTYTPGYQTISLGTNTYVGPYGAGESIQTVLHIPHSHEAIIVRFKLVLLNDWIDEAFILFIDGNAVYSITNDSEDNDLTTSGSCDNATSCSYKYVKVGLNHTGSTVALVLSSNIDDDSSSEAKWGICDLFIQPAEHSVSSGGYMLGGSDKPVQFSCSSPSVSVFWVYVPQYSVFMCNGYYYTGGYGAGGSISGNVTVSAHHLAILITMNIALVDSWEDEHFMVIADGNVVFSLAHNYKSSFSNTCQSFWGDHYVTVTFGFNHTAADLELIFTSDLDQSSQDESWGICNLIFTPLVVPVDSNGNLLEMAKQLTFSCASPVTDPDWTFTPKFQTTSCSSGDTYVGGYGSGASLSTTVYTLGYHHGIKIAFRLALFGSWNTSTFYVAVEGDVIYSLNYQYNESVATTTCQTSSDSGNYIDVQVGTNHSGFLAEITFGSDLSSDSEDASWGICDVDIQFTYGPVDANGYQVGAVNPLTFSCTSPEKHINWIYTPSYQTASCSNGNIYVGGFGAYGSLVTELRTDVPHHGLIVSFKLALFGTWNGEGFIVYADSRPVYSYTHDEVNESCESSDWDSYLEVKFGLNHTQSTVDLEFGSNLSQNSEDGSWGICDLSIYPVSNYVDINGNELQ